MKSRARQVRLGIFVAVSLAVLAIVVLLITGSKFMTTRDTYFIAYKDTSISGLEIGAAVKYHGIRIGRVETIKIDPEDVTKVVVKITVEGGTPVKEDVKALPEALRNIQAIPQIIIVTHEEELKNAADHKFEIKKENGTSSIKEV